MTEVNIRITHTESVAAGHGQVEQQPSGTPPVNRNRRVLSREPVAVALSGGLDSMVTALILKQRGHQVIGLHMILRPDQPEESGEHVYRLGARLGIDLHVVDLRPHFYEQVIKPFLKSYRLGNTPNPCVLCNPKIKFTLLREQAGKAGASMFATGHYVRLVADAPSEPLRLLRGRDRSKDQSYFLHGLGQGQLAKTVFPLGNLKKSEVRQLAQAAGLGDYYRSESQEICFVPDNDYRTFLEHHLGPDLPGPGPVVDLTGVQVGEHQGIHRYTIGQRRGLGIPSSEPYYVVGLEPETNTIRVGRRSDLGRKEMLVTQVNWIAPSPPTTELKALVQVRSRHREALAVLEPTSQEVTVRFLEPQMAITPGQAAVFYRHDEVLGGGMIERVIS
ncbi:MAG: tRNA 2-thiouridine(34) synthase MnmA [Deltaproteobacteria bacterium]|nr:MAG: tRNA 2-thiouridine(34) synthase MnmA [Deltaproteobacteria bacterium]